MPTGVDKNIRLHPQNALSWHARSFASTDIMNFKQTMEAIIVIYTLTALLIHQRISHCKVTILAILYVVRCAIWYHLYNLKKKKNVKNINGGESLLVQFQAKAYIFTENRDA